MATYGATNLASSETSAQVSSGSEGILSELMGGQPAPGRLTIPQKDLLMFFRQLAVILQSGVPLAQGMILIAENMTNKSLAIVFAGFHHDSVLAKSCHSASVNTPKSLNRSRLD